jgi:hypothetical protein
MALHFGHEEPQAWSPGPAGVAPGVKKREQPSVEEWGELVKQSPAASWYHHAREGTVTLVRLGQLPELIVDDAAWGVQVAPDDGAVAWSTGSLAEPSLHLRDVRRARWHELGVGAYPAWFPDSRHLVFSRPIGTVRSGEQDNVAGAELVMCDAATGASWALTDTADIAEMEPAVAPDGRSIAFADWHGGGLYRAAVVDEAQR